ncbi:hypothetical protein [Burkholderia cepacia]|uniref:hypothetical protein n=1 Tax=Burkholderia cepacia TaxID=292 RepID=UPI001E2B280A|nr:hypothetical protein [Burkholderia cepacia]
MIETNDQWPSVSDVWWILFDTNRRFACGFPQDAEGAKAAIDRLLDLPGVDHRKVIERRRRPGTRRSRSGSARHRRSRKTAKRTTST